MLPDEKKLWCVLYCRVGNASQLDHGFSIDQQRRMLLEYAQEMGYTCTAAYLDDGYSGLDPNRPGLTKLNADIEAGKVNTVLAKDPSRFWRDATSGGAWWGRMDKLGVVVLCRDAPDIQKYMLEMGRAFEGLHKRRKKKQRRHTVRMPPPPSKAR